MNFSGIYKIVNLMSESRKRLWVTNKKYAEAGKKRNCKFLNQWNSTSEGKAHSRENLKKINEARRQH